MSLARWDPFLQLNNLENEVNRRRQFSAQEQFGEALRRAEFAPPVHSYEDENRVTLKMEVSGIDTKDLDIRVDANTVTVSGERHLERPEKKENFRRVQRSYGSFTRSFHATCFSRYEQYRRHLQGWCAEN